MKNNVKKIVALVLAMVMALAAVSAMAETPRVYTLEELRAMSSEQLMALAIKDGSVQAKKAVGAGDQEIGLYTVEKGAPAPGNGRRVFVDLLSVGDKLIARESTAKWSSCFNAEGYCVSWCSAKTNNGLVKSAKAVKIRFFREAETGLVYIVVRGNAVGDNAGSGSGNGGNGGNGNATHQHASFTATPAGGNGQHAGFTAGNTGSQTASFTAGSAGENRSNSELTQNQLREKTGFHK